jgi:hypothetical protein
MRENILAGKMSKNTQRTIINAADISIRKNHVARTKIKNENLPRSDNISVLLSMIFIDSAQRLSKFKQGGGIELFVIQKTNV